MPHPTKKISSDALSPRNSVMMSSPISIHRNEKGFGFNFKVIRVYMGETDNYRLHHVVDVSVDNVIAIVCNGFWPDLFVYFMEYRKYIRT